jgi:hypothetical protein
MQSEIYQAPINKLDIIESKIKQEYNIIYEKALKHLNNYKIIGCLLNILQDAYLNTQNLANSDFLDFKKIQELLKIFYKIKIMNYNIFKIWSRHIYNLGENVFDIIIYIENNKLIYMLKTNFNNDKENTLEFYNNKKFHVTSEEVIYIARLLNIKIYDTPLNDIETKYIGNLLSSYIVPTVSKSFIQPFVQPVVQPNVKTNIKPIVQPVVQPIVQPNVKTNIKPIVQPVVQPNVQPVVQPNVKLVVQPEFTKVTYKKSKNSKTKQK